MEGLQRFGRFLKIFAQYMIAANYTTYTCCHGSSRVIYSRQLYNRHVLSWFLTRHIQPPIIQQTRVVMVPHASYTAANYTTDTCCHGSSRDTYLVYCATNIQVHVHAINIQCN